MTEPTDAELIAVANAAGLSEFTSLTDRHELGNQLLMFARAVLSKFGTPPAVVGEPVGEVQHLHELNDEWLSKLPIGTKLYTTPQPTQAQAGAVPLTESEMGEGWRKFQETLDDRMAADPAGVRSMGREHWLSWAHWKAACNFAHGIKGGQHGAP